MNVKLGIVALTSVLLLAACGGGTNTTPPPVTPTVGSVGFQNASGYTTVIRDAGGNVIPSSDYNKLKPGTYTVTYSKDGFVSQTQTFTVTAGQSVSLVAPTLQPVTATSSTGAFYMNAEGQMVAITRADLDNAGSRFVFYAWLENEADGVNVNDLEAGAVPTAGEREEIAPLGTQNLAAGYVGYRADNGTVYPVVGAGVRWDINEDKSQTPIRFATADDGAVASGAVRPLDVNDNAMSATTFTNRASGTNARFPSSADYPVNNVTGVNTPDTDGFTWTALWIPSSQAGSGTVTAVAEIAGTEINKTVLTKTFAPSARLSIIKEANQTVGLNQDGSFTVTVTNSGQGPATGITLEDRLTSGAEASYSIGAPAGGTLVGDSGFNATFDLAAGESRTFTFPARSNAVGVFCDTATVTGYTNGAFGVVTPTDLNDDACLTVQAPELTITKSLVDAGGNPIASGQQVAPNQEVFAAITVRNGGSAPATNVVVTDNLISGAAASYAIRTAAAGTTANGDDGFISEAFALAAGESRVFRFGAAATADGIYCDAGTFTATSNNGQALNGTSDQACFTVASPALAITKTNTQIQGQPPINTLTPGSSYNSTITVTNSGSADATAVAIKDLLGQMEGGSTFMNYGSGSYSVSGTAQTGSVSFANNTVSTVPETLTLAAGQTLTLNVTSTVPAGAPSGNYCDVASYTSGNAGSSQARACVTVVSFISEQTQLTDTTDPLRGDGSTSSVVASAAIVESASNEAAINNVLIYNFGAVDPVQQTPGIFNFSDTQVYYDPTPTRDPQTGAVTSDYLNTTARRLALGTEYTVSADSGAGQQTITLTPDFAVQPGGVLWLRTVVSAPAGTPARQYFETMRWNNTAQRSGTPQTNFKAESTTVVP